MKEYRTKDRNKIAKIEVCDLQFNTYNIRIYERAKLKQPFQPDFYLTVNCTNHPIDMALDVLTVEGFENIDMRMVS